LFHTTHSELRQAKIPVAGSYLKIFGLAAALLVAPVAQAGGPKYVAGVQYFNPGVVGKPVQWASGQVNYFVDQGPLSSSVSNQQATAMVDAAAAVWNAVPTAAVALRDMGNLNEDVNGANIAASNGAITQPADVTPSATGYPVGVIFDEDGSVIDAIFGAGASQPESCQNNGVFVWLDNIHPDATIAHGIILLNGLCATDSSLLTMMSFELERAFGRVLGLDSAQVNPGAATNGEANGELGWPVMQPLSGLCGPQGGACIPDPTRLRWDDIAALNRMYPVTAQNQGNFPGKLITAANTVSIQGTISFRAGEGMQGVNVVARPLDANGNPLYAYTVTFVSGSYFNGNHGNAVTGWNDDNGKPLAMWGSNDAAMQGFFDLSGMPLPPGVKTANYQVTFEAVNPEYILEDSVGPYIEGSPSPSGTLAPISVPAMTAGSAQTLTVNVANSAMSGYQGAIGTQAEPRRMPTSGMWCGRLSQLGQTDWFNFPVRGGRTFTVVTQALDETGAPSETKAMPAIGVWDAFDAAGAPAVGATPALNGNATGETWLRVSASGADVVRLGIADQRGDGRPDYAYNGWVLYADTVSPQRLPAAGGTIVIQGMGFHPSDTVLVGRQAATVVSITPNEITAIAPAAAAGVTGSVDVEVDDQPAFYAAAIISDGVSYDSGAGDALSLVTAPMNSVPVGVPLPFSVMALGADLSPAGGVTVTYTVSSGTATLGCGQTSCSVAATGDGRATMSVTAVNGNLAIVTASLTNGASVQAQFTGGVSPTLAAVTPMLSVAAGATVMWSVQALALSNGAPTAGQSVTWQSAPGMQVKGADVATTNASGIATQQLTVGPLAPGQLQIVSACLNGASQCVTFSALGSRPEFATLEAVSGTQQSLSVSGTPAPIVLRALDMDGNPMAAAVVSLSQALYAWAPPCPPHGRCAQSELLTTQSSTAVSALDGTVTFTPASLAGVATEMTGLAATGSSSSLTVTVEQHP
jgi:hypothetical protein